MNQAKCRAKTQSGKPCRANAGESGYCWAHDPALGSKRAAAHREGGLKRRVAVKVSGEAVSIADAGDVLKLTNKVILDSWELENSAARSRVLLAAGETAIKALQIGELEERVKRLEELSAHGRNH